MYPDITEFVVILKLCRNAYLSFTYAQLCYLDSKETSSTPKRNDKGANLRKRALVGRPKQRSAGPVKKHVGRHAWSSISDMCIPVFICKLCHVSWVMKYVNLNYAYEEPIITLVFHIFVVRSHTLLCINTILIGESKLYL